MVLAEVHELVGRVASVDARCADRLALEVAVADLRRLKSWVEGREVLLARSLAEVSSFPEKSLADAGRSSLRQAEQLMRRTETSGQDARVRNLAGRWAGSPVIMSTCSVGRYVSSNLDLEREERRRQQKEIADSLKESGALDEIFARIDAGESLTGHAGLLKGMLKASLERGLEAELTEHVGYEKGDPEASLFAELPQRHDPEDGRQRDRRCRAGDPA